MCRVFAGQDPAHYAMVTRRLRLNGQSTSIRLEAAFWTILDAMAADAVQTTPALLSELHAEAIEMQGEPFNFASMLRTACLLRSGRGPDAGTL